MKKSNYNIKKRLTIFTPTYNRRDTLSVLYNQLCCQSSSDFEWLIVDDGSMDDTGLLVKEWQNEGKIDIRYLYQENGGKMRAHNRGVLNSVTPLFICVDSDDFLLEDGVANILKHWDRIMERDDICGLVTYRGVDALTPLTDSSFPDVEYSTLSDLYRSGFYGDTSLVFKVSVLREYLFPEIEGEKFITENYIYSQIDRSYQLVVSPEVLIICKYRSDGYTLNQKRLRRENPLGHALYNRQNALYCKSVRDRCYYLLNYIAYALQGGSKRIISDSGLKCLTFMLWPAGYMLYLKRMRDYSIDEKKQRK